MHSAANERRGRALQDISREHNCAEKFAQINAAYETLSDPAARATYDIQRTAPLRRPDVQHRTAAEDPIYEMLRRHHKRHRARGGPFTATSAGDWCDRRTLPYLGRHR